MYQFSCIKLLLNYFKFLKFLKLYLQKNFDRHNILQINKFNFLRKIINLNKSLSFFLNHFKAPKRSRSLFSALRAANYLHLTFETF